MFRLLSVTVLIIFQCDPNWVVGQERVNELRGRRGEALNYKVVELTKWENEGVTFALAEPSESSAGELRSVLQRKRVPDDRVLAREIEFFDSKGKLASVKDMSTSGTNIVYSKNGEYALVQSQLKKVSKSEPGIERTELIYLGSESQWQKEEEYEWEGEPIRWFVSNLGIVVQVKTMSGILTFFDRSGESISEIAVFSESRWSRGRFMYCAFSSDGQYLAVNATDDVGGTFQGMTAVLLFDSRGQKIWTHETDEGNATVVDISPTNEVIVATSSTFESGDFTSRSIYFLDRQGQLIRRIPALANRFRFSPDGVYCAAIQDGAVILDVYEAHSAERFAHFDAGFRGKHVHAVDVNSKRKLIGMVTDAEISIVHFNGVPAWSSSEYVALLKQHKGQNGVLRFSLDGSEFVVVLSSGFLRFRVVE